MKQIIIVEDDRAILEPMTMILSNAGYRVTTFFDGEAILHGDFANPDLFIIDKQLSGVSGLELCRLLKRSEVTKSIPVMMMSASPDIHMLAKNAMADEALEKPFKMKELRDMVTRLVGK